MGMGLARDVRSANIASAERKERSKYRETAEARAERDMELKESREGRDVSAEKRAVNLDKSRIKSLKLGMKRGRKADKRSGRELEIRESAEKRSVDAAAMQRKIAQYKLENLKDPSVGNYRSYKRLLEDYQKDIVAVEKRNADTMGPLNAAIGVAEKTKSPDLPNLLKMREKELARYEDFKHGLEQSFMAASNRPHEGKWSIRPQNNWNGGISHALQFEGGSQSEAVAAMNTINAMGINVGAAVGANPATQAKAVDPNNPLDITRQSTTPSAP